MTLPEAILKARAEMKAPKKDKTAAMGHGRTYRYASLDALLDSVLPALTKHGITLLQPCSSGDGLVHVTTRLQLGEAATESTLSAPLSHGGFHEMGSAITYLRRYGLSSLLAISADEDEDGHAAQGAYETRPKDRSAAQPRGPQQPSNVDILCGTLEKVLKKDGTSPKGPWTRWAVKIEGFDDWVSTFDEHTGAKAEGLEGQRVRAKAIANGKGWRLDWIEDDTQDPQAVADAAIAADKAEQDDIPF